MYDKFAKSNSDFTKKPRLAATLPPVNVAITTIALPVARFVHGLAIFIASQLATLSYSMRENVA